MFTQQDIIDGNILYTHDGTATTSDAFAYTVKDPIGNELPGQSFSITVNPGANFNITWFDGNTGTRHSQGYRDYITAPQFSAPFGSITPNPPLLSGNKVRSIFLQSSTTQSSFWYLDFQIEGTLAVGFLQSVLFEWAGGSQSFDLTVAPRFIGPSTATGIATTYWSYHATLAQWNNMPNNGTAVTATFVTA